MANDLIVPLALAGRRIQRHDAVRKQVLPLSEGSVEVVRDSPGSDEHPAMLLVNRDATPPVATAEGLPLGPRLGVVPELAWLRNRVEHPFQLAGHGIEGTDMPGRGPVGLVDAAAENEQVPVHRAGSGHLQRDALRIHAEAHSQIDIAACPERSNQLAGPCVDRVGPVPDEVEDPLSLGTPPVRDPAIPLSDHRAVVIHGGVEQPNPLPDRRIKRHGIQARGDGVQDSVDDEWIRIHRRSFGRVPGAVLPSRPEPMHVSRVDLRQGGVLASSLISEIDRPVPVSECLNGVGQIMSDVCPLRRAGKNNEKRYAQKCRSTWQPSAKESSANCHFLSF